MANLRVLLMFLLVSVDLVLHLPKASASLKRSGGAARNVVATRTRRTDGGEVPVRVPFRATALGTAPPMFSGNADKYGEMMSPQSPPSEPPSSFSSSPPPPPPSPPPPSPPPPSPPPPADLGRCKYSVTTQTGDEWTASTESTISVRFHNNEGKNVYMVLTEGNIQTGEQNTFTNEEDCLPDICKMTLYTDGSGWLASWYVVWVHVVVQKVDDMGEIFASQNWQVNEWLPPHELSGPSSLVRNNCN